MHFKLSYLKFCSQLKQVCGEFLNTDWPLYENGWNFHLNNSVNTMDPASFELCCCTTVGDYCRASQPPTHQCAIKTRRRVSSSPDNQGTFERNAYIEIELPKTQCCFDYFNYELKLCLFSFQIYTLSHFYNEI